MGVVVADRIEAELRRLGWPVGAPLGSEAELVRRFGVGTAAVREAARILEVRGIARTRRGPGGGLFVSAPDRRGVTRAVSLFLERMRVERRHIVATWSALEGSAVVQLAGAIDGARADALREVLARDERALVTGGRLDPLALHLAIARLAENPVLELFITVLAEVVLARFDLPDDLGTSPAWLVERHRGLVEALLRGEADRAGERLRDLVRSVDAAMEAGGGREPATN